MSDPSPMMPSGFDPQLTLSNATLTLRPLAQADRAALYAIAADPAVWAGHPAKDRHERAVFDRYFDMLLGTRATLVAIDNAEQRAMGCSRYYAAPDHPDSVSIGFTFLGRDWWGGAANFAMKALMFGHAFEMVDTVYLHIDLANVRSQRATAKLGAEHAYDAALDIGGKPGLRQCWTLSKAQWARTLARHSM